ncbi:hypothetical protein MGAST_16625 [Mycobacterium gastri 'Wayne']|uniref:Uncharacterized protein n=1 Tax=Mycobacterium gastri TaxID=1777 RepID=A0A1X1VEC0_MYCGS|nr:hypothetical protein MGAST_16625 [Mycobacterium gastri 'Wayne']ORV67351.1 hypothetical protein AWC07_09305 [Mycobacterium gastri]
MPCQWTAPAYVVGLDEVFFDHCGSNGEWMPCVATFLDSASLSITDCVHYCTAAARRRKRHYLVWCAKKFGVS